MTNAGDLPASIVRAALSAILFTGAVAAPCDGAAGPELTRGGPTEGQSAIRLVEIRSYNLKPGTVDTFEGLFLEESRPLLDEWGIDVVAYGRPLHDENSWFLIRSFDDTAQRKRVESAFYGSDEWREGPRDAILGCIEFYTTLVLSFDEETVARLRRSLRND